MTDHLASDLHHTLTDDGVDLARHDRGSGLSGGEHEFTDPAPRARSEPADVVGDLRETHRDGAKLTGGFHHAIPGRLSFEMIRRFSKIDPMPLLQRSRDPTSKFVMGVDAGSDRGSPDGEILREALHGPFCTDNPVFNLRRKTGKFLANSHGRRILKVRATSLDHLIPLL